MGETLVVNLYGAPGSGKSTGAAYIFAKLKMLGVNCELITEFAKDKVWENNLEVFNNQLYILGKQSFKTSRVLFNKVFGVSWEDDMLVSEGLTFTSDVTGRLQKLLEKI